ncbi:MAG: DUF3784 domain-containing protein [Peptococcia bacterium]
MQYGALLTMLLPVAILVIIGFMVKYRRAYWLISGYNTMSKEKKQNVDIEGLANFTGNFCFALAVLIGVASALLVGGYDIAAGVLFAFLLPLSIFVIIKTQQYDHNSRNADGTMQRKSLLKLGLTIAFLVIVGIGAGVLLYFSYQPTELLITEEYVQIKGMYGEKIPYTELKEVALIQEIPEITARTNGSSIGERRKGHFRLKDLGAAKLFLVSSQPPYIYLERNDKKPIIINFADKEETERVHGELDEAWQQ